MSKQNEKYKFSIVVPCYNEEKNIPILVERFKNFIENENILIVLVDNGSSDGSKALIEDLVKTYNFSSIIIFLMMYYRSFQGYLIFFTRSPSNFLVSPNVRLGNKKIRDLNNFRTITFYCISNPIAFLPILI